MISSEREPGEAEENTDTVAEENDVSDRTTEDTASYQERVEKLIEYLSS